MGAEEMRHLSDKTVAELVEIICRLLVVIKEQDQQLQVLGR